MRPFVRHAYILAHYALRVVLVVEGRDIGHVFLGQPLGVALLNACAVHQHDGAQVAGSGGGIDRALETVLGEPREESGMVDVCVAQDHGVDA